MSFTKTSNAKVDLDVRGMRLTECQSLVENALVDLLNGDVPYISVVHGHGDGILKKWLREYLRRSPDFSGGPPENGNDGETKITLR